MICRGVVERCWRRVGREGAQVTALWNSCGGLGGNVRFTMVSRGPSPPSSGNCDFFLFPERTYYGDVPHSYIVEFKHLKKGAKKQELEAQRKEGIAQLKRYAKDKKVPSLAKGTTLHLILVQYRGPKMANCELVGERKL